jgi:hypothetical protein
MPVHRPSEAYQDHLESRPTLAVVIFMGNVSAYNYGRQLLRIDGTAVANPGLIGRHEMFSIGGLPNLAEREAEHEFTSSARPVGGND